jgi:hypothetical protein
MAVKLSDMAAGFRPEISCPDINYQSILQNHTFTNTEQKYIMLLPFERGMFAVS